MCLCVPQGQAFVIGPLHMYKIVLITSIVLIVAGMLLTAFSLFSPLWQIVDRPKFGEIHQHGLWWDCVESDGTLIPLPYTRSEQKEKQCLSKFDPIAQSNLRSMLEGNDESLKELLLHRFLPHHKAVIFFSLFTLLFGIIGIITGACSPCFPPNSLLYVVSIFMTGACSLLSDIIFIFGATKNNGTPEDVTSSDDIQNRLGIACYLHILGTSFFTLALIFSIGTAYLLISSNKGHEGCCTSKKDYIQEYRYQQDARSMFSCDRRTCRPIVVEEDDFL